MVSGVKNLVEPPPTDPSKELRFVCLEGNEAGTYFRGQAQWIDGHVGFQAIRAKRDGTPHEPPASVRRRLARNAVD